MTGSESGASGHAEGRVTQGLTGEARRQAAVDAAMLRVHAELRPGGHPCRVTIEQTRRLREEHGAMMPVEATNLSVLNLEERLCQLEMQPAPILHTHRVDL